MAEMDPSLISQTMQGALAEHGVQVRLAQRKPHLHILLESGDICDLPRDPLLAILRDHLAGSDLSGIEAVQVYGRIPGQKQPLWQERLDLTPPAQEIDLTDPEWASFRPPIPPRPFDPLASEASPPATDGLNSQNRLSDILEDIRRKQKEDKPSPAPPDEDPDDGLLLHRGGIAFVQESLNHLLSLRPNELRLILVLGCMLMANSIATQISAVTSVSGFLSAGGVEQILIIWVVDFALILVTTSLQSLIVDRVNRIGLMRGTIFSFVMAFVLLRLMFTLQVPAWLNYSLLYLLSEQQWLFFPLIFWILANDVFDMAQSKRLFPILASWSFAGKILGLVIAALSPALLNALNANRDELLTLNVFIYLLVFLLAWVGLNKVRLRPISRKQESIRASLSEGWEFIREIPSFRFLTLCIIAWCVSMTIVEFHFLVISDRAFPTQDGYQSFYSLYNLGVTFVALGLQAFLTSRIINAISLKNAFFVLPVSLVLGSIWMLLLPGIQGVLGFAATKLSQLTIDESARKSFQALVPEERRGRVSIFMDSYLFAAGVIIGCLVAVGILVAANLLNQPDPQYVYLTVATIVSIVAVWSVIKMRATYDSSLLNWRLKRRQRGKSVLDKLVF